MEVLIGLGLFNWPIGTMVYDYGAALEIIWGIFHGVISLRIY